MISKGQSYIGIVRYDTESTRAWSKEYNMNKINTGCPTYITLLYRVIVLDKF